MHIKEFSMTVRLEKGPCSFEELVLELDPVQPEIMQEALHNVHEHQYEPCCS